MIRSFFNRITCVEWLADQQTKDSYFGCSFFKRISTKKFRFSILNSCYEIHFYPYRLFMHYRVNKMGFIYKFAIMYTVTPLKEHHQSLLKVNDLKFIFVTLKYHNNITILILMSLFPFKFDINIFLSIQLSNQKMSVCLLIFSFMSILVNMEELSYQFKANMIYNFSHTTIFKI